jgi:hypothetical protein
MNLDFVAAFANNPITLAILMVGATVVVLIWKGQPLIKDFFARNDHLSEKIDKLLESDAEQSEAIKDVQANVCHNTRDILRMTIYNEVVDIEDRLVASRRYLLRGGNGKALPYIKQLAADNPDAWRAIVAMSSDKERAILEKVV